MSTREFGLLVPWAVLFLLVGGCGGGGGGDDAPSERFAIRGNMSGSVVQDVPMLLRGDASDERATDENGNFEFPDLLPGTYSVIPDLSGVEFSPPNVQVRILGADFTEANFVSSGEPPPILGYPPENPIRLVFVHPQFANEWLNNGNGVLGDRLGKDNYYVSDITWGWSALPGPDNTLIGNRTDIGHWYTWFADRSLQSNGTETRENITRDLYAHDGFFATYDRSLVTSPGGDNEIVVFESSFTNSDVMDTISGQDPALLQGKASSDPAHTFDNCKAIYDGILEYFMATPEKLFVLVTPPPRASDDPSNPQLSDAVNARNLNDWLVDGWLRDANWENKNVAVFDLFNVLTDEGNHHRLHEGNIQHVTVSISNYVAAAYMYGGGNSAPNPTGNQKATEEFVPLLNVAYQYWLVFKGP